MKDKKIIENCQIAEKNLRTYGKADSNEVLKKFNTSTKGLSVVDIEERLDEYGKNTIEIPLIIPGIESGKVTEVKIFTLLAPKSFAASS